MPKDRRPFPSIKSHIPSVLPANLSIPSKRTKMASSSKTLVEIFQPVKRLKSLPTSPENLTPKSSISTLCKPFATDGTSSGGDLPLESPSTITPDQKRWIEINKALARSKRNLRLCNEKIERAKAEGMDYVKLEEILVDKMWLEALPGEL